MVKTLKLTQNKQTLVDDEDYNRFSGRRFYYNAKYARTSVSKHKKLYLHRMILDLGIGEECDHINGDKLDNRRCNLRAVTRSQNNMNAVKHRNTTSNYKGVCWDKEKRRWGSAITIANTQRHLGYYDSQEDAANAYNEAAIKLFGVYAKLNIIVS